MFCDVWSMLSCRLQVVINFWGKLIKLESCASQDYTLFCFCFFIIYKWNVVGRVLFPYILSVTVPSLSWVSIFINKKYAIISLIWYQWYHNKHTFCFSSPSLMYREEISSSSSDKNNDSTIHHIKDSSQSHSSRWKFRIGCGLSTIKQQQQQSYLESWNVEWSEPFFPRAGNEASLSSQEQTAIHQWKVIAFTRIWFSFWYMGAV